MMAKDPEALLCDLAETYHIYNYKELPCKMVALFSCGLREDSRIKMRMAGEKATRKEILLASIADRLGMLVWFQTKDGAKGINRPESITETLLGGKREDNSEVMAFDTGDDFSQLWNSIAAQEGGPDGN